MNDNQNQYQFPNSSLISSCDQGASHGDYHMPQQREPNGLLSTGGSSSVPQEIHDLLSIGGSSNHHLLHQPTDNMWLPSKMRWIRKMLISKQRGIRTLPTIQDEVQLDQASNNDNNSTSGVIRVCSNCNTTKTPLWRGGPQGPKSLCNACGIRQMKARRAMRANVGNTIPFKKRFKNINTSFSPSTSTVTSNNNNNKTMKKEKHVRLLEEVTKRKLTFPQEERDAAILLMALSSGLIHG